MTRNKKIIIIVFVVIGGLFIGLWAGLDSDIKCRLIYGKNICNFYKMMDIMAYDYLDDADFNKAMQLCRDMEDVLKKDNCFEYVAEVISFWDFEKAKQACDEIKGFDNVHSKEDCHKQIQQPIEERTVESMLEEYNQTRTSEQKEEVIRNIKAIFGQDLEIAFKEALTRYYSYGIPNPGITTDFVQLKVIEVYEDNKGFTTEIDVKNNEILKREKSCTQETQWITAEQAKEASENLLAELVDNPENYNLTAEHTYTRTYYSVWHRSYEEEFYNSIPEGKGRELAKMEERTIVICLLNGELMSYEYKPALTEEEIGEMTEKWEETQRRDIEAIRGVLDNPNAELSFVNWLTVTAENKTYRVYRDENGYCYDVDEDRNVIPDTEILRSCKTPQL